MTEYCVCGHAKDQHEEPMSFYCWYEHVSTFEHPCKKFVLDKLKYIEDAARQRGLI